MGEKRDELREELKDVVMEAIRILMETPTAENISRIPPLAELVIQLYSM